ncbi:MAG: LiaF-related protein [Melioribacteraceae bacterium]|nr:MAG: LiaF-related protein [Melioribacteraceae bacterium]
MKGRINISLIIGLALVILGGLFLLDNFDVIYFDVPWWIFKWQSILIIIGLLILANSENKTAGYILIAIGLFAWFPGLWPLVLIGLGFYILYKRRDTPKQFSDEDKDSPFNEETDEYLNDVSVFGGGKKVINSQNFKGGKITAIFGGSEIDLYECKLAKGTNYLDVFAMFGGSDITMPADWNVRIDVVPIFGGFSDKRRKDPNQVPDPEKKLIIKGLVLFGGGNLKS